MGKAMNVYATQAKEKARQQRQTNKALKRMLTRQKMTYAKTSAPNTQTDGTEPVKTGGPVQSSE